MGHAHVQHLIYLHDNFCFRFIFTECQMYEKQRQCVGIVFFVMVMMVADYLRNTCLVTSTVVPLLLATLKRGHPL